MGAQAVRLSNVDIDNALKNKDFEVLFQPIFDLGNGALARMETFVRWRHQSLGVLPPGAFISFFESQGRMSELTRYVLGEALREYSEWRGPYAPGFSINLAFSDLGDKSFGAHFTKLLRDNDFPAELVTLECPMPPVDVDLETAAASFTSVKSTGARLAIEVRGRANDFLKNIDPFPFDEIKTGGSAILRFARTVRGPGLSAISDLLDIANTANAAITAVGVEDQASLAALRGLGFTAAQGNHLGKVGQLRDFRPARVNEVREILELEPLSQEGLSALFRTAAPELKASKAATVATASPAKRDDALVDRLNERVAQQAVADEKTQSEQQKKELADKVQETAKAKLREKKLKEREVRKAAAIARAKSKNAPKEVAALGTAPDNDAIFTDVIENDQPVAPREWQDRLTEEFKKVDEPTGKDRDNSPARSAQDSNKSGEVKKPEVKVQPEEKPKKAKQAAATPSQDKPAVKDKPAGKSAQGAAVAKSETSISDVQPDVAASLNENQTVSLSAINVAAHLIPEIKVGAPALAAGPLILRDNPPEAAPEITMAQDSGTRPSYDPPELQPAAAASVEPKDARSIPEIIGGDAFEKAIARKEMVSEEDSSFGSDEPPVRRRNAKNFLTRKYRIWPTHFWPKSWKRSWARKAAERARLQVEANAADAVAE